MRILVIEPAGGLWGSERALLDLIASAPTLQFAVCGPPHTPLCAELQRRGIPLFPWFVERLHEKPRWRRAQAALGVLRACMAFRPDAIHLNQTGAWRVALPAAMLLRLPLIAHVRIFEDVAYLAERRPSPAQLGAVVAISGAVEQELRRRPELAAIPVHRLLDAYQSQPEAAPVARHPHRLACVGRITTIKGQELLLQALAEAEALSDAECLLIGAGEPEVVQPLKARSPRQVVWCGVAANVPELLRSCNVLVCPSHREPLGRVIFEAWDAGAVPVVFAGSGGAAEVVSAADAGLLYTEQTPAALGQAIVAALALPPAEHARLIANGRAWLLANCSPQHYGQAITRVFEQACRL
jgi:glycosyltransferase involved in cell wall biosynthesis